MRMLFPYRTFIDSLSENQKLFVMYDETSDEFAVYAFFNDMEVFCATQRSSKKIRRFSSLDTIFTTFCDWEIVIPRRNKKSSV